MSRPFLPDPRDDAIIADFYAARKDQPMSLQSHWRAPPTKREPTPNPDSLYQRVVRWREDEHGQAAFLAEQARAERLEEWRAAIRREADERATLRRVATVVAAGVVAVLIVLAGVQVW